MHKTTSTMIALAISLFSFSSAMAQRPSCGCGSGLHSGGAAPVGPSFNAINKAKNSSQYAAPFVAVKAGSEVTEKIVCPYGTCSCGAKETVTSQKIKWIPYSKYQELVESGQQIEVAEGAKIEKSKFSQSKKFQLSNLYHLSNHGSKESQVAAIELYENLLSYLGDDFDTQIKDLIRQSVNIDGDRQKTKAAYNKYKELIESLSQEQLTKAPAGLLAYREYFASAVGL